MIIATDHILRLAAAVGELPEEAPAMLAGRSGFPTTCRPHPRKDAGRLQNPDRRIVFAIPYQERFPLIGTTDEAWEGAPGRATIGQG